MFKASSEIDHLMDILGNETRRRILNLIAEEPHYFNQICRELNVSQQAILKHLEILERFNIIESFREKSELGAPERKYYRLQRSLYISIGITKDFVNIQLRDLDEDQTNQNKEERNIIYHNKKRLGEENRSLNDILQSSNRNLKQINERLGELEREKVSLMNNRQNLIKKTHDVIRLNFPSILERNILYSLICSDSSINVETLSEQLNVREKEIRNHINNLRRSISIPFD
jgi:ArsR family transcriptional regulator